MALRSRLFRRRRHLIRQKPDHHCWLNFAVIIAKVSPRRAELFACRKQAFDDVATTA